MPMGWHLADTPENHLVVLQERGIRRTWHNEEWWFAIVATESYLKERAERASADKFRTAMTAVPNTEPEDFDRF